MSSRRLVEKKTLDKKDKKDIHEKMKERIERAKKQHEEHFELIRKLFRKTGQR